jgi:hypothetical protein
MTSSDRLTVASASLRDVTDDVREARSLVDPVAQRRAIVRVAKGLRGIADLLDQNGYLTE